MALSLSTRSLPCVTGSAVCAVQCGVEKTTRDPSLKSTYCGKQQKGRERGRARDTHRKTERQKSLAAKRPKRSIAAPKITTVQYAPVSHGFLCDCIERQTQKQQKRQKRETTTTSIKGSYWVGNHKLQKE